MMERCSTFNVYRREIVGRRKESSFAEFDLIFDHFDLEKSPSTLTLILSNLMASVTIREREQDDADFERYSKRPKVEDTTQPVEGSSTEPVQPDTILPPSHILLNAPKAVDTSDGVFRLLETDVGISEYVGKGVSKIEGIIKQRFVSIIFLCRLLLIEYIVQIHRLSGLRGRPR